MISEYEKTIQQLSEKPARSAAEQHRYEKVKKELQALGDKGIRALRFLHEHGAMKFGVYNPPNIPSGLTAADLLWVYNHCSTVGIVRCEEGKLGTGERTFQISEAMAPILEEVLYETDSATSAG